MSQVQAPVATEANPATPGLEAREAPRLYALDALRGLLLVLMALDHANHFVAQQHPPAEIWDGVFPSYDSPLAFITRLVTHLAAPGFFLLMGAGMALLTRTRRERGWSRWAIIRHFWVRGLVLLAVQLLLVNRAWELSPGGWGVRVYFGVLCALGGAMIVCSLLVWLKPPYLLILALVLLLGTELLHPGPGMWDSVPHSPPYVIWLWPGGTSYVWCFYPILPWLELVVLGMALGQGLFENRRKAERWMWILGVALLAAFVVVRVLDGFGNIRPRAGDTWIDWLNVVKYPPSLAFTTLTTGVNLLLLWGFSQAGERARRLTQTLVTFGRVPLFFYVLHLYLYLILGRVLAPNGTSIPRMYAVWLLGLAILILPCLGYGWLKHRSPHRSLLRLL
jgi:uncharacterized membrane protein